jgi:hypothetical protein
MVFYYSINSAFKPWKECLKFKKYEIASQGSAFKPWKEFKNDSFTSNSFEMASQSSAFKPWKIIK